MSMTKYGLIGHPLGHSLSPYIHERIMEAAGIRGSYQLLDIAPEEVSRALPGLMREFAGLNVTIPHKTAVIEHLSRLDPKAELCGAVNTISHGVGYNTDIDGFSAAAPSLQNKQVLILGAGGVSRMMAFEAVRQNAAVDISVRNSEKAHRLASELRSMGAERVSVLSNDDLKTAGDYDVLLNGTPLGMWPFCGEMPVPRERLHAGMEVFDTVYNPAATKLVLHAKKQGARAVGGLSMLLGQAIAAERIWHPEAFIEDKIAQDILPDLSRELLKRSPVKYVLTGFMGAGKTSVGKMTAKRLGIKLIDLDEEIVRQVGLPVPDIFARDGEAGFRRLEAEVLETVLAQPDSAIVALGGGAIIEERVRETIRAKDALTIYLHASLDHLWLKVGQDAGRPMMKFPEEEDSARFSRVARLYETRLPIYRNYCDYELNTENDFSEATTELIDALGYGGKI